MSPDFPLDAGDATLQDEFSLPSLPASRPPAASITAQLASRFHGSLFATRISSNGLVVLNTHQAAPRNSTAVKEDATLPEVVEVVDGALARLSRLFENQTFLFLGESGSGKSTFRSQVLETILKRSQNRLSTIASLTTSVFDSLTTARTETALLPSKSDFLYQLQFDTSKTEPVLVGGAFVNHFLQRRRITHIPNNEGSYRILHYLVAGASDAEAAHYGFKNRQGSMNRWKLLGPSARLRKNPRDVECFHIFKRALWEMNFQQSEIVRICELLAVVLHLRQLEFQQSAALEREDPNDVIHYEDSVNLVTVQNPDTLNLISTLLGVQTAHLEALIATQAKTVGTEAITIALSPPKAQANAASLASMFYALTTRHIIDRMNQETCAPDGSSINTISFVDFSGFLHQPSTGSTLDQLLRNSSAEFMYNLSLHAVKQKVDVLQAEEIVTVATEYFDNSDAVKDLLNSHMGLLSILEERWRNACTETWLLQRMRNRFEGQSSAIRVKSSISGLPLGDFHKRDTTAHFTVQHFAGEVEYSIRGLMNEEWDATWDEFGDFFKYSKNGFVASLFRQEGVPDAWSSQNSTRARDSYVTSPAAHEINPTSYSVDTSPSSETGSRLGVLADDARDLEDTGRGPIPRHTLPCFLTMLRDASKSVKCPNTNLYLMFSLNSNDRRIPGQFSTPSVRAQVQALGIPEIIDGARSVDFNIAVPFGRYIASAGLDVGPAGTELETVVSIFRGKRWPKNEAVIGSTSVLMSERRWMELEKLGDGTTAPLRVDPHSRISRGFTHPELVNSSSERLLSVTANGYGDGNQASGLGADNPIPSSENEASTVGTNDSLRTSQDREATISQGIRQQKIDVEASKKEGSGRRFWIFMVYAFTFFIPDLFIRRLGGMSNKDVRMAWREKLAINIIIWSSCAIAIFFVMFVPLLICPKQHVLNAKELLSHNGKKGSKGSYVAIRGEVFDLAAFLPHHYPYYLDPKLLTQYAGSDISSLFPVQVSALCAGVNGSVSDGVTLDDKPYNLTALSSSVIDSQYQYAKYHDFRAFTNDSRPDWFSEQMKMFRARYRKGAFGYSPKSITKLVKKDHKVVGVLRGRVYDLTVYMSGGRHQ